MSNGQTGENVAESGQNGRSATRRVEAPLGSNVNNLPVQLSLIVPSTSHGEQMPTREFRQRVSRVRKWFSARFGGDTTVRGSGGFIDENELIDEDVAIVESSMSIETYREERSTFADYVRSKREDWGQDAVTYQVEDRVFIYPEKGYIDHDEDVPTDLVKVL